MKLDFDPTTCKYTKDLGYYDITPSADGGVLKKVLEQPCQHGEDDHHELDIKQRNPVEGCNVKVQYVGKLENGEIFDTTRDMYGGTCIGGTDDPKSFVLLREKVVEGFDLAVATMVVGEMSR